MNDDDDLNNLENIRYILSKFILFYEVIPYKGMIDYDRMEITLNPAFSQYIAEILMHEIIHYCFPDYSEEYVKEKAKSLVENSEDLRSFLESWCIFYAYKRRTSTIFGMI